MTDAWRPSANAAALRARDALYKSIRAFFSQRDFLEVDVPVLSRAGSTDPHLHSFTSQLHLSADRAEDLYLQTSPEFFMKRLLAAGSGPIFSISKSFRQGESGRLHNPEFTLLEWYQPGFDDRQLMDQVAELLQEVLPQVFPLQRISYRQAFAEHFGFDPHRATLPELKQTVADHFDIDWDDDNPSTWLEFLFSHGIQPKLEGLTFVYDYPAPQAALAKVMPDERGELVAKRFEVFIRGIELGNGYWELTDGAEQALRFERDNEQRLAMGLPGVTADSHLVAALKHGMPECAGIALGLDRLLMIILDATSIDQVLCFPLAPR